MLVVGSVYMIDLYSITLISYISCIKVVVNIYHIKMYNSILWIHADFLSHIRLAFQVEPRQNYRGADKSLAWPTSRCILFDGENTLINASLYKQY
jgi:hypothetical protein